MIRAETAFWVASVVRVRVLTLLYTDTTSDPGSHIGKIGQAASAEREMNLDKREPTNQLAIILNYEQLITPSWAMCGLPLFSLS